MRTFIFALLAGLMMTGGANAGIINIDNIDAQAGTYSGFVATAIDVDTITLTGMADYDMGGATDTLSFTLARTFYTAGSTVNSSGDVTLPAADPNTAGNLGNGNNWFSAFGLGDTQELAVSNIVYTSGEADGTTAVFSGFQAIGRTEFGSGAAGGNGAGSDPLDFLVHTGPVGSTTINSPGGGGTVIDLTSAGTSNTVFITNDPANNPTNTASLGGIRLRDLDLQFETVPAVVPEPTSFAILLGGLSMLAMRRRRN